MRAHNVHSDEYRRPIEEGDAYKPARAGRIKEVGDFPLLARRVPRRDAWIAWVWPNATGYFGNTATPCTHMDPVLKACPAGTPRSIFGRMSFFEGTWDELSLDGRSGSGTLLRPSAQATRAASEVRQAARYLPTHRPPHAEVRVRSPHVRCAATGLSPHVLRVGG